MTPELCLAKLQELEQTLGRGPRGVKHEPRLLDLDLLVYGGEVRRAAGLTLPHPRAHLRRFVLEPWNEVAPNLVLPGVGRAVSELLAELPADQPVEKLR
jgi:2-amino-4-hydroxy-6-hydroxymethyldihydropteridine diphosphokinase